MKKNTLILLVCLFSVTLLSAQSTYTVSSPDDDGTGTLRHFVSNVEAGDIINIPSGYTIVLNSEIAIEKHITINGQGATIKVAEPGVSTHRLFTLGTASGGSILNISLKDLKLQGGDIKLNTEGSSPNHGGAILIVKRVNLALNNCEITDSKADRGGAIYVGDGVGVSALFEDCLFKGNSASSYGGACAFLKSQSQTDGPGEAVIKNTVFEANTSGGSAAMTMNIPATFTSCIFKDNASSGTSRGSCTFQVNDNPSGNVRLNSCTFAGNTTAAIDPEGNADGGIFVAQKGPTTTYFLTNCTFYDNHGGRGTIYLFAGKMFMVNCTITGNVAYNKNNYAGGFYGTTDATNETKEAIFVNNIFAYNYSMNNSNSQILDTYFGAKPVISADKNVIASTRKANDAPVTITNPVAFFYDDDPSYDDPLFESYTTNRNGHKIPAYDAVTGTVALAANGVATGTGLSKEMVIDPEIEALIPLEDQRGLTRSTTAPSLGSYEYGALTSIDNKVSEKVAPYITTNPATGYLYLNNNDQISRMDIIDLAGRVVVSQVYPDSSISLSNVPNGYYIVRFETPAGVITEKLIVR